MELIEAELSDRILGACVRVHRAQGPGFLESVDEEALAVEFVCSGIAFERQKLVVVVDEDHPVGEHRLDFLAAGRVVLELKACKAIDDVHLAISKSYLSLSPRLRFAG